MLWIKDDEDNVSCYKRIEEIEYVEIDYKPKLDEIEYNRIPGSIRGDRYLRIYYLNDNREGLKKRVNEEWKIRWEGSEEEKIRNSIREKRVYVVCNGSKLDNSFREYFIIMDDEIKNKVSENLCLTR